MAFNSNNQYNPNIKKNDIHITLNQNASYEKFGIYANIFTILIYNIFMLSKNIA